MTTQRRNDLKAMPAEKRQAIDKYPARRFPIQHEIQKLQKELNDFNEQIAELEKVGHQGHAMEVLRASAVDYARQIDELRCLLVEPAAKDGPKDESRKLHLSKN
jgi:uncharacterized coiled-coil DUF342 family protein